MPVATRRAGRFFATVSIGSRPCAVVRWLRQAPTGRSYEGNG